MERSAEARSAEVIRKGEARRAEPTWHSLYAEARRAEGRGPKGRGEILGVVNLWGNGSELYSGSPQVIMPKGVSQGTSTSRCRPLTVSETFRHTDLYYLLITSRAEILGAKNWRRVQCVGEQVCRERSAEARSAKFLRKGESRRGTVFILRPAGPKVETRRAEAKFWVWLI